MASQGVHRTFSSSISALQSSIVRSSSRETEGLGSTSCPFVICPSGSFGSYREPANRPSRHVLSRQHGRREIVPQLVHSTRTESSSRLCPDVHFSKTSESDVYGSYEIRGRSTTGRICFLLERSILSSPKTVSGKNWGSRRQQGTLRSKIVCRATEGSGVGSLEWLSRASPYEVLGVSADSSEEDIKAAFRARIKEYHPDVYQGLGDADAITQRLLRAYEILIANGEQTTVKRKSLDPFVDPECVAEDLFVNELACIGRGCPYSCVERAPDVFQFASDTGSARAMNQGKGGEYHVQLAVGQCPRNCIHYLTPEQRFRLEEILERALEGTIYSSEVISMEGLLARAKFENGRYQPPKRKPKRSEKWVDWY